MDVEDKKQSKLFMKKMPIQIEHTSLDAVRGYIRNLQITVSDVAEEFEACRHHAGHHLHQRHYQQKGNL